MWRFQGEKKKKGTRPIKKGQVRGGDQKKHFQPQELPYGKTSLEKMCRFLAE